jgi:hypothetical protein
VFFAVGPALVVAVFSFDRRPIARLEEHFMGVAERNATAAEGAEKIAIAWLELALKPELTPRDRMDLALYLDSLHHYTDAIPAYREAEDQLARDITGAKSYVSWLIRLGEYRDAARFVDRFSGNDEQRRVALLGRLTLTHRRALARLGSGQE